MNSRYAFYFLASGFFPTLLTALTFSDWSTAPEYLGDPTISEATADSDGDDLQNLHEYAFVGDPLTPDVNLKPRPELFTEGLALTYRERQGMTDVSIHLQGSETLMNWITYNTVAEVGRTTFADYDEVTLLDPGPFPFARRFLRLRVELSPPAEPRAPTHLSLGVVTPTTWGLSWTDPNATEVGYAVERLLPTNVWEPLETLGSDTGTWRHTSADYQTSMTYRVVTLGANNTVAESDPVSLLDSDGDGIPDALELGEGYTGLAGTYASFDDQFSSNGSGVSDGWLAANGFDPATHDSGLDSDGDGLTDLQESLEGTNPNLEDTDSDGVLDLEDGWARFPGLAPVRRPEVSYAVVPITDAPAGAGGRFLNNKGHAILKAGESWYFWDGTTAHALSGNAEYLIAEITDFDDEDRYAAHLQPVSEPSPFDPEPPPVFATGQGASPIMVRQLPRWPADILDLTEGPDSLYAPDYRWEGADYYFEGEEVHYAGLTPSGGLLAEVSFRAPVYYWPTVPYPLEDVGNHFDVFRNANFEWGESSVQAGIPSTEELDVYNYGTTIRFNFYSGEKFVPMGHNKRGLTIGIRRGPHDGVLRMVGDDARELAFGSPRLIGPVVVANGVTLPLDPPAVNAAHEDFWYSEPYGKPRWINSHNHIGGSNAEGQPVLWINTDAGFRDDQPVDDTPTYQKYVWSDENGDAPPRLNAQLEGLDSYYVDPAQPWINRIWRNGRWHLLAPRVPATQGTEPTWQITSIHTQNDHGLIVALATRLRDNQGSPITNPQPEPALLAPFSVKIMKPDSWDDELPEGQVLLFDEKVRIKVSIAFPLSSLVELKEFCGSTIQIKTLGTFPVGVGIELTDQNCTFTSGIDYAEARLELTRQQLIGLGLLPTDDLDGIPEIAWYDVAHPAPSNLNDSLAFQAGMASHVLRGRSSPSPANGTLQSIPPNSPIDQSFVFSGGAEIIIAEINGARSKCNQIANQADIFYYSGHGQAAGSIGGKEPEQMLWNKEMSIAILAGCSVLDINDYNGNARYSVPSGTLTPGERWNNTGPEFLLGYNHVAPSDEQNSDDIVSEWTGTRLSQGNAMAWMNANDNSNGRNACAIHKDTLYYYFHRTTFLGVPSYTLTTIPASSW